MQFLLLSIACSTILTLIFKWFGVFKIDNLAAIVINYWVCVLTGSLVLGVMPITNGFWTAPWFPFSLILGALFISGFYSIARTAQEFSVTVSSVMQKMSLIITVIYSIIAFSEPVNALKIVGLLLAFCSVILTNLPPKGQPFIREGAHKNLLLFPIWAFLSSGLIECILKYVNERVVTDPNESVKLSIFLFATAGVIGTTLLLASPERRTIAQPKNILAGILLGIPNFFSIHFLLKVIASGWDGSVVFPVNNIAIIVCSALAAGIIFREKLSLNNWAGVALAVSSILLIMFST